MDGATTAISLISSDEEAAPPAAAPPSSTRKRKAATEEAAPPAASPPNSKRKRKAATKKGGRSWRSRAGDASSSSASSSSASTSVEDAAAANLATSLTLPALRGALLAFGLKPGGRQKAAMASRLLRARRAAAASAALYPGGPGESSSSSAALPPRFDAARAGHVGHTLEACRLCARRLEPPRKTFCCDECVHFHLLRTSGAHVRKALALRDGRRCALCGIDCAAAYSVARAAVRAAALGVHGTDGSAADAQSALSRSVAGSPFAEHARLSATKPGRRGRGRPRVKEGSFWQADHVVAVHEGGGSCGLDNFRTLCTPCHANVTGAQAARRAQRRRAGTSSSSGQGSADATQLEHAAHLGGQVIGQADEESSAESGAGDGDGGEEDDGDGGEENGDGDDELDDEEADEEADEEGVREMLRPSDDDEEDEEECEMVD